MRSGVTGGIESTVPNTAVLYFRRDGPNLSLLRQAPGLRPEPLALDGRHEAPVRREPPEGPHHGGRRAEARIRLHALPEGGQGRKGVVPGTPWPIRAFSASASLSRLPWRSSNPDARR